MIGEKLQLIGTAKTLYGLLLLLLYVEGDKKKTAASVDMKMH